MANKHDLQDMIPFLLKKRIKASKPGGAWRNWRSDLVANYHKSESGRGYASVYGRMKWDEPSPTVTAQLFWFGNGRSGHPEQNRALSLLEGALLLGVHKKVQIRGAGRDGANERHWSFGQQCRTRYPS